MTSGDVDYVLTVEWHFIRSRAVVTCAEGFAELCPGETEYQLMRRCLQLLSDRVEADHREKPRSRVIKFWRMMSQEPLR